MVSKQANSKISIVNVLTRGGVLAAIWEIFTSPTSSPQDVAKGYPGVAGTPNEDKFWDHWVGPGRNFPLPPVDPSQRPQWLADYWPEGMPIDLPNPENVPHIDTKPVGDEGDEDDGYITLYRGVGEAIKPQELYAMAEKGTAWPKGLLPGHTPNTGPDAADDHTMGDNETIWTSWSRDKSTAFHFATDFTGQGVILSKRFKKSQLVQSTKYRHLMQEEEYLVPGVVENANVERVTNPNRR
jgi:hypothetical protein